MEEVGFEARGEVGSGGVDGVTAWAGGGCRGFRCFRRHHTTKRDGKKCECDGHEKVGARHSRTGSSGG